MTRPTIPVYVTEALGKMAAQASPREVHRLSDMLEHYRREFRRIASEPDGGPLSVAFTLHEMIDEAMTRLVKTDKNAHRVACSKGCSHCCYLRVTIDTNEAALLVAWAAEEGIEIDRARLERQAGKSLTQWRALSHADRACVFLGQAGECRVYAHRPASCRKYLVVDDPTTCDTVKHANGRVGMLASPEAEALASAANATFTLGSLASLVLDALRANEPAQSNAR